MVCQHNTNWSSNTLVPEVLEPNSDDVQNRQWVDRLDAQWLEGIWRIKGKEPTKMDEGLDEGVRGVPGFRGVSAETKLGLEES